MTVVVQFRDGVVADVRDDRVWRSTDPLRAYELNVALGPDGVDAFAQNLTIAGYRPWLAAHRAVELFGGTILSDPPPPIPTTWPDGSPIIV